MQYRVVLFLAITVLGIVLVRTLPGDCACAPGERQSYFYGIITGRDFKQGHELRGYIGERLAGTTSANPGRLEELADQVQFALYLCGDSVDTGTTVEFRYSRGKKEYAVEVLKGDPSFQGREIEIGAFPVLPEAELELKVTGKTVVTAPEGSDGDGAHSGEGSSEDETSGAGDSEQAMGADPDVNRDGSVDSSDAAIVLNHVLFSGNPDNSDDASARFDVTGDGIVNTDDVKEIYRRRYD